MDCASFALHTATTKGSGDSCGLVHRHSETKSLDFLTSPRPVFINVRLREQGLFLYDARNVTDDLGAHLRLSLDHSMRNAWDEVPLDPVPHARAKTRQRQAIAIGLVGRTSTRGEFATPTGFAEIQAIDGWPIKPHRT